VAVGIGVLRLDTTVAQILLSVPFIFLKKLLTHLITMVMVLLDYICGEDN
jgi:hypothetical protein